MADPIDTHALREAVCLRSDGVAHATIILCDEVDRLRAENTALAAALADLADAVKAIPRHYAVEDLPWCHLCAQPWPCPTERAHRTHSA